MLRTLFGRKNPAAASEEITAVATRPGTAVIRVVLQLSFPQVPPNSHVYVVGSAPELGSWDTARAARMDDAGFPVWNLRLTLSQHSLPIEYKFILRDEQQRVTWEEGSNRRIELPEIVPLNSVRDRFELEALGAEARAGAAGPASASSEPHVQFVRRPDPTAVAACRERHEARQKAKADSARLLAGSSPAAEAASAATPAAAPAPEPLTNQQRAHPPSDLSSTAAIANGSNLPYVPLSGLKPRASELVDLSVLPPTLPSMQPRAASSSSTGAQPDASASAPPSVQPVPVQLIDDAVVGDAHTPPGNPLTLLQERLVPAAEVVAPSGGAASPARPRVHSAAHSSDASSDDYDVEASRSVQDSSCNTLIVISDQVLRLAQPWRAAGVTLPVFSLRSTQGMGTGEFLDIPKFVDWIAAAGFHVLHILPVHDTYVRGHPSETSPYRAVSVFALHPLYLNIDAVGRALVEAGGSVDAELLERIAAARAQHNGSVGASTSGISASRPLSHSRGSSSSSVVNMYSGTAGMPSRPTLDYEAVMRSKLSLARDLYRAAGSATLTSAEFGRFFFANRDWLQPYALYCFFRDLLLDPDPRGWGARTRITPAQVQALTDPSQLHHTSIAFYYFVQYHLHVQLQQAAAYAQSRGVLLQVDMAPGCSRASCDVWVHPHLFALDKNMAAAPDRFSPEGQNFGYPPYDWRAMEKDDYRWWRRRLAHASQYVSGVTLQTDVLFRSLLTPATAVTGLMGVFEPALPFTLRELREEGIRATQRLTEPWIKEWSVRAALGPRFAELVPKLFHVREGGTYEFREAYATEEKLRAALAGTPAEDVLIPLLHLLSNSCLIVERVDPALVAPRRAAVKSASAGSMTASTAAVAAASGASSASKAASLEDAADYGDEDDSDTVYHPRLALTETTSFLELDESVRNAVKRLHRQYFGGKQTALWTATGLKRLSVLQQCLSAVNAGGGGTASAACAALLWSTGPPPPSEMMDVLRHLGVPAHRLQRLGQGEHAAGLADPSTYEYCSVAATGSADTPNLRSWYETDATLATHYAHTQLGLRGELPKTCTPDIVSAIVQQHLASPAVFALFPMSDVLGMDAALRCADPHSERVNIPAIPQHHWRMRLHITTEELLSDAGMALAAKVRRMIEGAGRACPA